MVEISFLQERGNFIYCRPIDQQRANDRFFRGNIMRGEFIVIHDGLLLLVKNDF